jgi:hypothetical protein
VCKLAVSHVQQLLLRMRALSVDGEPLAAFRAALAAVPEPTTKDVRKVTGDATWAANRPGKFPVELSFGGMTNGDRRYFSFAWVVHEYNTTKMCNRCAHAMGPVYGWVLTPNPEAPVRWVNMEDDGRGATQQRYKATVPVPLQLEPHIAKGLPAVLHAWGSTQGLEASLRLATFGGRARPGLTMEEEALVQGQVRAAEGLLRVLFPNDADRATLLTRTGQEIVEAAVKALTTAKPATILRPSSPAPFVKRSRLIRGLKACGNCPHPYVRAFSLRHRDGNAADNIALLGACAEGSRPLFLTRQGDGEAVATPDAVTLPRVSLDGHYAAVLRKLRATNPRKANNRRKGRWLNPGWPREDVPGVVQPAAPSPAKNKLALDRAGRAVRFTRRALRNVQA